MVPINALAFGLALLSAQPVGAPSITFDPASPQATDVHWTITLSAPFCGGFRIGDGVYLRAEPPLTLPDDISSDAVLFDGQPADVLLQDGVVRVTPSHALPQPTVCQPGARQFTVELLGSLGLTNPDAGVYAVDVWFGSDSGDTPTTLPITIATRTPAKMPLTRCDPIQLQVDAATAALQADNSALSGTFDAIRAQTSRITAEAPGLVSAQADLVHQLDDVQATGRAMASSGWNPDVAFTVPATEWAQGRAVADLAALRNLDLQPAGAPQSSVAIVISLVQLAQQQAHDGDSASQHLQDVLQQFADCGLGVPPAP